MCYNCGCHIADYDMGRGHAVAEPEGRAITQKTFEEVAKAFGMSVEETKRQVYEMLKEEFEEHSHEAHTHAH